ncbi:hypothetical protein CVT26_009420 [Gymnopilus dilepis]|uniref:Uncharacterized protein n=1 Tax=Gymnopilus dilepis TaxID=231916 RepID=A0A409VKC9_9AGAR|nr:hypothetical protein CVT26_009420 [Gymnopilus dilepis]
MNVAETTSDYANGGYNSASDSHHSDAEGEEAHLPPPPAPVPQPKPAPKKRGRPPKHLSRQQPAASAAPPHSSLSPPYKPLNPKSAAPGKQKQAHHKRSSSTKTKVRQNLKARRASLVKKAGKKRRALTSDEEDSSSESESALSDHQYVHPHAHMHMDAYAHTRAPYMQEEDDMSSSLFPTFVSASALSSMSSDNSDSSSLSDFDSDASLVKEEENFIIADVHEKARLKRELLGGDDPLLHGQRKRSARNSDWVVRPRKKSVGPSDAENGMDVDSDATEDEDDDDDEDEDDEGDDDETEEDTVMMAVPPPVSVSAQSQGEEEDDTDDHRRRYVGFATGWSEDEESGVDAELFFANLLDSESSSSDSDSDSPNPLQPAFSLGEDGDQSDISCTSECTEGGFTRRRAALESLPFEVTESWDGQIVFTNGAHDNSVQGIIDIEFEADASRFVMESSASPGVSDDEVEGAARRRDRRRGHAHQPSSLGFGYGLGFTSSDSDVDMLSEGGYEEEDPEGELGSGDTTDEELVGADDLPNERAMRLFSLPLSVSAINPLSTVSTPNVSPGGGAGGRGRRGRREREKEMREKRIRMWGREGVSASDILQGRVVFWDEDEEEMEWDGDGDGSSGEEGRRGGAFGGRNGSEERRTPAGPRKGVFVHCAETRQAVIGDERKGDEVPSPHPRFTTLGSLPFDPFPLSFAGERCAHTVSPQVEHLLRRHLLQSLNASTSSPLPLSIDGSSSVLGSPSSSIITSGAAGSSNTLGDDRSPLELLLSSAAAAVGAEDGAGGVGGVSEGASMQAEAEAIELGDVLEASFLDDPEPEPASSSAAANQEGADTQMTNESNACTTPTTTTSTSNTQAQDEAGVKNLSRWDLISVGAFRQSTQIGHLHTPGSSADFGSAIKSSPLSAVLWQNGGASAIVGSSSSHVLGHGHVNAHGHLGHGHPVGTGGARQVPGAGLIKGKGSKLAKRRRIMMGGGGSAMSSPLILPVGSSSSPTHPSASSPSASTSTSLVPYKEHKHHHKEHHHQRDSNQNNQNHTRKESRRERKLLKKRSSGGPVHAPHLAHSHHGHAFHTHHQHLPNSKMRSVSGAQRMGLGGVPPLNL